ncbi:unnamed protein product [Periconia digitata]|uniref:Uncharacterized protein n=1 Tax=Periconia digitata TaxID=1303443 RepID=A0A9W4XJ76_9PLEO|nr:unnamed protein product [Periconia digitata]
MYGFEICVVCSCYVTSQCSKTNDCASCASVSVPSDVTIQHQYSITSLTVYLLCRLQQSIPSTSKSASLAMDTLSQEIIDQIASYLHWPRDTREQLLIVSKAFQNSVERKTLAKFYLRQGNTDNFLRLYSGERIRYLREVKFTSTFPTSQGDRNFSEGCREKPSDLLEKDELFTRQIGVLFSTLKSLEDRIGAEKMAGKLRLTIFPPRRSVDCRRCHHRVCVCWRVHLLNPGTLPQLCSIHTLKFKHRGWWSTTGWSHDSDSLDYQVPSKLDLRIMIDIASKLSKLERLKWKLDIFWDEMNSARRAERHYMQDWAGPHRDTRHDFAKAIDSVELPSSLKHVDLDFHRGAEDYMDQNEVRPNLVLPRHYDSFSSGLRMLSSQLVTLSLRIIADQTLFWPTDENAPNWPNLKYLHVEFTHYSPSGTWYFQGPQGEGSDTSPGYEITKAHYEPMEANSTDNEYDTKTRVGRYVTHTDTQFRIVPIERTLNPLLISFARAAACMPSLRKAVLCTCLEFNPRDIYDYYNDFLEEIEQKGGTNGDCNLMDWGIAYAKPGENIPIKGMGHTNCASRQFWWMTQDWRPDTTLCTLIHKIGAQQHGKEAIDHWASDQGHPWDTGRTLTRGL